jgi:uncharacterized protein YkwD
MQKVRTALWWVVTLTLVWSALLATTQSASAQAFQLYVPMVVGNPAVSTGTGTSPEECGLNEQEVALAGLALNEPGQRRDNPVCNPILSQVARAKARDMALRGYFSHTNPDGIGPNQLVRQAGYKLPDWYGSAPNANNIESIGAGYTSAQEVWNGWLDSPAHRTHVLGTQEFYADQDAYGVGYYYSPDAPFKHYWVFLSAPVEE